MTADAPIPIFDGHNDLLLRLWRSGSAAPEQDFLREGTSGHLDLPRARRGGFAGGLFAVFAPSGPDGAEPTPAEALTATVGMISLLARIERASGSDFRTCRSGAEIRAAMASGAIAAVLHVEGAEMIDPELRMLDVLYQAGLRSLGPVWSRSNIFGHGVPFRYPSSPDTGPGLTAQGRALVQRCNELRVMVDLSHLNEQGFWDVAALSDAPLVASHSNAHALNPHSRNLTDRQLDAIRDSDGFVGVNFGTKFLRTEDQGETDAMIEDVLRHVDYLVGRVGVERVGFGSDFDGTTLPADLSDVTLLPAMVTMMRDRGYDDETLRRLCSENWISLLERTWGG